jgi:Kdo2-lipid IVA lauroyltransferase/acyltransferase
LKSRLTYHVLWSIIWCWSLLPMWALHLQSRGLAFIAHRVIGYRRKVVLDNLRQAFPEKSEREVQQIAAAFYLNFTDLIVEIVKMASLSTERLQRRVTITNPEIMPQMITHGGGGVAFFGHFANWEWLAAGLGTRLPFETFGVYKTLSNAAFDRIMLRIRTRHGNGMVTMEQTFRWSLANLKERRYLGFLGDQTPPRHTGMYFTRFLGRPAPVYLGIATICLKMNVPLYHFDIRRVRRGHYAIRFAHIPHADLLPFSKEGVHMLTDRHVAALEAAIRDAPSDWLWSHRRWKHQPREGDILSPLLD